MASCDWPMSELQRALCLLSCHILPIVPPSIHQQAVSHARSAATTEFHRHDSACAHRCEPSVFSLSSSHMQCRGRRLLDTLCASAVQQRAVDA